MKKLMLLSVVLAMVALSTQADDRFFKSSEEARAAYYAKTAVPYKAIHLGRYNENPVNGTTRVLKGLLHDAVVHLSTTAGYQYVIQLAGEPYRWESTPSETLKVYARNDCGNPADEVFYLLPAPAPAVPPPVPPQAQAAAPPTPTESYVHVDVTGRVQVDVVHHGLETAAVAPTPEPPAKVRWRDKPHPVLTFIGGVVVGYAVDRVTHGHGGRGPGGKVKGVGPGGTIGGVGPGGTIGGVR